MTQDKEFYTVKEVADLLRVKPRTIYRWIEDGIIVATKPIRAIRIHKLDVAAFIREHETNE